MKYIYLSNDKGKVIVDNDDYELLNKRKWSISTRGYAHCGFNQVNGKRKMIFMHRYLISPRKDQEVDHINHNPLDNRRSNLRIADRSLNMANSSIFKNNTSGHKGVTWCKERNKWQAQISVNKVHRILGRFEDKLDAINAYKGAAEKFFGSYSYFK